MRVLVVLVALAVAALALGAMIWRDAAALTRPASSVDPALARLTPRSAFGAAFSEVAFAAAPGARLRGWLVPARKDAKDLIVVAMHGRGGDRHTALPHARLWREAGAAALLIDLRGAGESDGQGLGNGLAMREAEDALAAAEAARAFGYRRVVVAGWSLGASAAILAAARDRKIDGLMVECALKSFPDYGADIVQARFGGLAPRAIAAPLGTAIVALGRWRAGVGPLTAPVDVIEQIAPRPILILHGARDAVTPPYHGWELARAAGETARLVTLPNAAHCDGLRADEAAYRAAVLDFLGAIAAAP
ncbi:MAG: alpha/beta fold hydrolase [Hyphomonadaceae bacterium]|nr:alpha/beta fold hydrolase [Hyphomonadaceae bacterium]